MINKISSPVFMNTSYKNVSFGTLEREIFSDEKRTKIEYRNNTMIFRNDINWKKMANYIIKDNPKQIFCYACSDGSEPYTIAIMLISKLGWDEAQKYFPIIAKDNDPYAIKKAKSGYINLRECDIKEMMKNQKNRFSEFFTFKKKTAFLKGYSTYKVSDRLKSCVNFEVGDIVTDAKSINYDNSIIFFRNVWPYLSHEQKEILMKIFSENFKENTSLVVGGFDENPKTEPYFVWTDFEEEMKQHNLYSIYPRIYRKYDVSNFKDFMKVFLLKLFH